MKYYTSVIDEYPTLLLRLNCVATRYTPNLTLDMHVTSLSAKCFFQLRNYTPYPTLAR